MCPPRSWRSCSSATRRSAQEDTALVVSVQAGLDSGAVPQGRLMPESEQLIADFQRRVHDAIS